MLGSHSLLDSHWEGGSFLPMGGSASVAKTLVAAITRRGGAVLVRAPVSEILLERGVAVGVRCRGVEVRGGHLSHPPLDLLHFALEFLLHRVFLLGELLAGRAASRQGARGRGAP